MSTSLDEYLEDKESWISGLFSNASTPIFDSFFGILVPILCIIFDPGIFHPVCSNERYGYASYLYAAITVEITVLILWLIFYERIKRGLEGIAGIFFIGMAVAFIPIIILFPIKFGWIGSILCLWIVGIPPSLIAFVYLRNGVRAFRRARRRNPSHPTRQLLIVLVSMLIFTLAVPTFVRSQPPSVFPINVESSPFYSALCTPSYGQ